MDAYTPPQSVRPERLEVFFALAQALEAFPHLRVGQLLENARAGMSYSAFDDLFYVPDYVLAEALRDYVRAHGPALRGEEGR